VSTSKPLAPWYCQECGRAFKTTKAAERALSEGCPKCGGCDVDCMPPQTEAERAEAAQRRSECYGDVEWRLVP
jgi:predicted  nucleic acid-binding Zn-ribbon protein